MPDKIKSEYLQGLRLFYGIFFRLLDRNLLNCQLVQFQARKSWE